MLGVWDVGNVAFFSPFWVGRGGGVRGLAQNFGGHILLGPEPNYPHINFIILGNTVIEL